MNCVCSKLLPIKGNEVTALNLQDAGVSRHDDTIKCLFDDGKVTLFLITISLSNQ